ncbi:MAG: CotH kinase family protein, partial [Clostridia bacterium]|nr:CotH kinase family protein [Clostridia bacterium]
AYGDMTEEADYLAACDMLDMDSFADYLALTFYICNDDSIFEGNNWQLWRVREPEENAIAPADGKWRVMLFDSDHAAGVYQSGANYMERNIDGKIFDEAEDGHPARLAQSLIWNDDFMEKLITAMLDVRNLYFEESRASKLLNDMTAQYQPYAPDTFRRFGPMWGPWWDAKGAYGNNLRDVGTFFTGRYDGFPSVLQDAFSLDDPITVTLAAEGAGMIRVNGRSVTVTKPLELVYFPGLPLTLEAIAQDGSAFTFWQIPESDTVIEDLCTPSFTLYPEESITLTAVFE